MDHFDGRECKTGVYLNCKKRAARVILDVNITDRSKDLFRQLDWLPFKDEVNLQKCSLL